MTNVLSKYREYVPDTLVNHHFYPEDTQVTSPLLAHYTVTPVFSTDTDLYPMKVYSTDGVIITITDEESS